MCYLLFLPCCFYFLFFSLAAFNICSLCLIFVNSINVCLGVFHLGFILFGTLWVSWTCVTISFPILGKFSAIISSSIFSWPLFLSSSGTPNESNVGAFHIVPEVPEVVLISFDSFFLFLLCLIYFHHFVFYITYPIFCLHYSTVGSLQSVFYLIYCITHF